MNIPWPFKSKKVSYYEYLQSSAWQKKRDKVLKRARYKCELCYNPYNLEVHHKTYDHLGREYLHEMICLCRRCHSKFHDMLENGDNNDLWRIQE
jgi:5-methylcytosine-specific restriction endonuclease McrA